jgi:hypothetical protein
VDRGLHHVADTCILTLLREPLKEMAVHFVKRQDKYTLWDSHWRHKAHMLLSIHLTHTHTHTHTHIYYMYCIYKLSSYNTSSMFTPTTLSSSNSTLWVMFCLLSISQWDCVPCYNDHMNCSCNHYHWSYTLYILLHNNWRMNEWTGGNYTPVLFILYNW